MNFIIKHKLSISIILFTLLFFLLFLYIDLAQVLFSLSKNATNNYFWAFIGKTWFFLIPTIALIPVMIIFTIQYLKLNDKKIKWLYFSLILLFELLYTFVYSLYAMAGGLSFFPSKYIDEVLEYKNIKEITVDIDNNKYTSLYYDNDKSEVSIVFVGNNQTSTLVFNYLKEELNNSDRNVLIMDYPMFGKNEGKLNEETVYKEVDAYMSFLINEEGYDYNNIRVCGFSIGTGVATYCASKYQDVKELILFAPYHKFSACMNMVTPVFYGPLELCVRFKFNSYDRAKDVKCHTTVYYSDSDKRIPRSSTELLITRFNDVDTFLYNGYSHGKVFLNDNTANLLLH